MSKITFFNKTVRTEAELQKAFVKKMTALGFLCYKFSSPAKRGVPDYLIICPNGETVFVEFKNPTSNNGLSKLQALEIRKMREHGASVYVVHDGDEAEVAFEQIIDFSKQVMR